MWNHLTPRNIIDMQRRAAIAHAGEQARKLLEDGYATEADRILDDLSVRRESWANGAVPSAAEFEA